MNRYQTEGIILKRVNYGEADRILTFVTPDHGKVTAMAKGVRKPKSKLAGGLELFSVCDLSLIKGKGSMHTVVSTRLKTYFDQLITDYAQMEFGYDMIRLINGFTQDDQTAEYYQLLKDGLDVLNGARVQTPTAMCWFLMQLAKLHGGTPNMLTDHAGNDLAADKTYAFSAEDGAFFISDMGVFGADEIKAWRVFASADARQIRAFTGLDEAAEKSVQTLKSFIEYQI